MTKGNDAQLALDLTSTPEKAVSTIKSAEVINFVDAATLRVRSEAIKRVAAAGIFELPPGIRFS